MKLVRPSGSKNKYTTGFSIRQNVNNTKNPYTLTVITRPYDSNNTSQKVIRFESGASSAEKSERFSYNTNNGNADENVRMQQGINYNNEATTSNPTQRRGKRPEVINEQNKTHYYIKTKNQRHRKIINTTPAVSTSTKYINNERLPELMTDIKIDEYIGKEKKTNYLIKQESETLEDKAVIVDQNVDGLNSKKLKATVEETTSESPITPYKILDNFQNPYIDDSIQDYATSSTSSTTIKSTFESVDQRKVDEEKYISQRPSYYSYSVDDVVIPDHTTEVLNGKVGNVIKTFFNNLASRSKNIQEFYPTTPNIISTTSENVVNIGYKKKLLKHIDTKPFRTNIKSLQIITEPSTSTFIPTSVDSARFTELFDDVRQGFPNDPTSTVSYIKTTPIDLTNFKTTTKTTESTTDNRYSDENSDSFQLKFSKILTTEHPVDKQFKDEKIVVDRLPIKESGYLHTSYVDLVSETTKPTITNIEQTLPNETGNYQSLPTMSDVASTTSTTKSTTTVEVEPKMTTKSLSFPTRASRVNPAIKLAAANLGGGRRSYQSSTNCSSDNSLQANPKCNEIKYQRYIVRRRVVNAA